MINRLYLVSILFISNLVSNAHAVEVSHNQIRLLRSKTGVLVQRDGLQILLECNTLVNSIEIGGALRKDRVIEYLVHGYSVDPSRNENANTLLAILLELSEQPNDQDRLRSLISRVWAQMQKDKNFRLLHTLVRSHEIPPAAVDALMGRYVKWIFSSANYEETGHSLLEEYFFKSPRDSRDIVPNVVSSQPFQKKVFNDLMRDWLYSFSGTSPDLIDARVRAIRTISRFLTYFHDFSPANGFPLGTSKLPHLKKTAYIDWFNEAVRIELVRLLKSGEECRIRFTNIYTAIQSRVETRQLLVLPTILKYALDSLMGEINTQIVQKKSIQMQSSSVAAIVKFFDLFDVNSVQALKLGRDDFDIRKIYQHLQSDKYSQNIAHFAQLLNTLQPNFAAANSNGQSSSSQLDRLLSDSPVYEAVQSQPSVNDVMEEIARFSSSLARSVPSPLSPLDMPPLSPLTVIKSPSFSSGVESSVKVEPGLDRTPRVIRRKRPVAGPRVEIDLTGDEEPTLEQEAQKLDELAGKESDSVLFDRYLALLKRIPPENMKLRLDVLESLGETALNLERYEDSIDYNKEWLGLADQFSLINDSEESKLIRSQMHHNIGIAYVSLGGYKSAATHFRRAIRIRPFLEDPSDDLSSRQELAQVYFILKDQTNYIKIVTDTLLSIETHDLHKNISHGFVAFLELSLADVYFDLGNDQRETELQSEYYQKALDFYNRALKSASQIPNQVENLQTKPMIMDNLWVAGSEALAYYNAAVASRKMRVDGASLNYYLKALQVKDEDGSRTLENRFPALRTRAKGEVSRLKKSLLKRNKSKFILDAESEVEGTGFIEGTDSDEKKMPEAEPETGLESSQDLERQFEDIEHQFNEQRVQEDMDSLSPKPSTRSRAKKRRKFGALRTASSSPSRSDDEFKPQSASEAPVAEPQAKRKAAPRATSHLDPVPASSSAQSSRELPAQLREVIDLGESLGTITARSKDYELFLFNQYDVGNVDNSCLFNSLGVSREAAARKLLENSHDSTVRRLAAREIEQTLLDPDSTESPLPRQIRNMPEYQDLYTAYLRLQTELSGVEREVNLIRRNQMNIVSAGHADSLVTWYHEFSTSSHPSAHYRETVSQLSEPMGRLTTIRGKVSQNMSEIRQFSSTEQVFRAFVEYLLLGRTEQGSYFMPTYFPATSEQGRPVTQTSFIDAIAYVENIALNIWLQPSDGGHDYTSVHRFRPSNPAFNGRAPRKVDLGHIDSEKTFGLISSDRRSTHNHFTVLVLHGDSIVDL